MKRRIKSAAVKDANGEITEIHCTYDPASRGGNSPDGRKVKGTIHWVSEAKGIDVEVRLFDRLFSVPDPENIAEDGNFKDTLNPDSLKILNAKAEPYLKDAPVMTHYQFERIGYFCVDVDSTDAKKVFNRTVSLKDSWAKIEGRQ